MHGKQLYNTDAKYTYVATVQTSHNLNACRVLRVKASCFTRDFCSTDTQTHAFTCVDQFDIIHCSM